ncbi:hypothetical protein ACROYT_G040248 [Oculina patagonica]
MFKASSSASDLVFVAEGESRNPYGFLRAIEKRGSFPNEDMATLCRLAGWSEESGAWRLYVKQVFEHSIDASGLLYSDLRTPEERVAYLKDVKSHYNFRLVAPEKISKLLKTACQLPQRSGQTFVLQPKRPGSKSLLQIWKKQDQGADETCELSRNATKVPRRSIRGSEANVYPSIQGLTHSSINSMLIARKGYSEWHQAVFGESQKLQSFCLALFRAGYAPTTIMQIHLSGLCIWLPSCCLPHFILEVGEAASLGPESAEVMKQETGPYFVRLTIRVAN